MDSFELALTPEETQQQLAEKDQLIQALTGRLEEAAEQLDRIRRNGSDRGVRISGGGSSEFHEQQQSVLESLSATVEKWEEIQPRDAFDRLELRLDNLRSLMEAALDGGIAFSGSASSSATTARQDSAASRSETESAKSEEPKPKEDTLSGWEAMKAQLMSGSDAAPAPSTPQPQPAPTSTPSSAETSPSPPVEPPAVTETAAASEVNSFTPTPTEDVPIPVPVEFETADKNDLKQAVEDRDAYIGYLTRRLQNEAQRTRPTINWEILNNAPEDLKATMQDLEADLMERLRIAEVDLSLERARLSRIKANVDATKRQVEKRLQEQVSMRPKPPAKNADNAPSKDEGNPKGWLSSLGLH